MKWPHCSDYMSVLDPNSKFIHMMRNLEGKVFDNKNNCNGI